MGTSSLTKTTNPDSPSGSNSSADVTFKLVITACMSIEGGLTSQLDTKPAMSLEKPRHGSLKDWKVLLLVSKTPSAISANSPIASWEARA
jgi:hypothetical protein